MHARPLDSLPEMRPAVALALPAPIRRSCSHVSPLQERKPETNTGAAQKSYLLGSATLCLQLHRCTELGPLTTLQKSLQPHCRDQWLGVRLGNMNALATGCKLCLSMLCPRCARRLRSHSRRRFGAPAATCLPSKQEYQHPKRDSLHDGLHELANR